MMTFLEIRARLRNFYQKYELYLEPVFKFILAFVVFQMINASIGYDDRLKRVTIVLILSLLSAFTPSSVFILLAAIVSFGHMYFMSKIFSIFIIVVILVMYCLFLRFTPKLGYVIVAVPILYFLKIPYLIPIVLGLFTTPISIIPTSCGVIAYFMIHVIKEASTMEVEMSIESILKVYTFIIDNLFKNKQLQMTILIFALIIVVTYIVRRKKFDYAHEISVAAGALTCILGFLFSDLRLDISEQIGPMILGTVISGLIALGIHFFHLALDYSGVEHVQFEDDDYYYYVKAVPKINVTTQQLNIKRINAQTNTVLRDGITGKMNIDELSEYDDEDYEDYDDDESKDDEK